AWSTSAQILDELAEAGHEFPKKILEWRQVSKMKSTYNDALPTYVHPQTHRVHTTYALAATTTGRLSSNEPNLQNIPVRTEDGRKIRRAFVATAGHKLVSADYSQIELRLLAGIADIPVLKQAFRDGLDIHAMTAAAMFGVPLAGTPGARRRRWSGVPSKACPARCGAAPRRSISASSTASRPLALPTSSASPAKKL